MSHDISPEQQLKVCTKCGREFPATTEYFYRASWCRDELKPHCKTCAKTYNEAYYEANKEHLKAYREDNKENLKVYREANKEQIAARRKAYREANKELRKAYDKAYYKANKENISARVKAYREANKEKINAHVKTYRNTEHAKQIMRIKSHRRRVREKENGGSLTAADIEAALKASGGRCWICGKKLKGKYHIDHWIPLSKGGTNDAGNIRIVHPRCNLEKSTKHPYDIGRLI